MIKQLSVLVSNNPGNLFNVVEILKENNIECYVSMEERMACGIGACLSCTCESANGGKRKKVCTDGPVFWAEEVL